MSITGPNQDDSEVESSPSTPRNPDESLSNIGSPLLSHGSYIKKKSAGRLHFGQLVIKDRRPLSITIITILAFNLLKSSNKPNDQDDEQWEDGTTMNLDDSAGEEPSSTGGVNSDIRSRISFRNAAQKVNNHFRKRQSFSTENGLPDIQGSQSSYNLAL